LSAHLVGSFSEASAFRGLPLQPNSLARDFFKNIVHPRQGQLGIFQASFGQNAFLV